MEAIHTEVWSNESFELPNSRNAGAITYERAWGGGFNFTWQGEDYWAPTVEAAERFMKRVSEANQ